MKLSDALRKYADDLDVGRPLAASAITVVAVDDKGLCQATFMGHAVNVRDAGIAMCIGGADRFLQSTPKNVVRAST